MEIELGQNGLGADVNGVGAVDGVDVVDAATAAAAAAALDGRDIEHDINMDDLFGAEPTVAPVAKGLTKRLVQLADSGSCQRIAWSKYGPIAAITPDSKGVNCYCLLKDPKSSRWVLSKPVPLKLPDNHDVCLRHVSWSFIGTDLAILDASGRTMIYNCPLGHAHLDLKKGPAPDSDAGEMGCIVGLYWLPPTPQAQKLTVYWSAQLTGDSWTWNREDHRLSGPFNPIDSKTALISISRGSKMRIAYQVSDSSWRDKTIPIDDMLVNYDTYLTHAAFAPEREDGLLMATYNTDNLLRVYKIKIDWGVPKEEGPARQQPKVVDPTLKFTSLKAVAHCMPSIPDDTELGALSAGDDSQYVLTHLEMVAPPVDPDKKKQHFPTVLTVFRHADPVDGAPLSGPPSVIWTWEMQPVEHGSLSSAFDGLTAKKKPTGSVKSRHSLALKQHSSATLPNAVLAVTPIRCNSVFAISMADGSVEFLRRDSLQTITADYDFAAVYSLPQSGFSFVPTEPVVHTELSPSGCVALSQNPEGELKLSVMECTTTDLTHPADAARRSAMATALALQWSSALYQWTSCPDDILALMPPNVDAELQYEFLEQAYAAINVNLDFQGDEAQKTSGMFFRSPLLQKLMGAQAVMGSPRSMSAKLAYFSLNIRLAAFILMMMLRQDVPLTADIAFSLCGMVQWCLDFMVYILQEVDRLSEHLKNGNGSERTAIEAFIASGNSPAVFLLLCSVPRTLIRWTCRPLRYGWIHCMRGAQAATTPQAKSGFQKALMLFNTSPVCTNRPAQGQQGPAPVIPFEHFIAQVEQVIKEAYTTAGMTDAQRAQCEKQMFIRAQLPDALVSAVSRLVTQTWPKFTQLPGVDLGRIYKHDVTWLGITEDAWTRQWHKRHLVDVVRKEILPPQVANRKCARCGSRMEDIEPGPRWPSWVVGCMKNCICMGNWAGISS